MKMTWLGSHSCEALFEAKAILQGGDRKRAKIRLAALLCFVWAIGILPGIPMTASADEIVLKSGSKFEGEIISESETQIEFAVTGMGTIAFDKSSVAQITRSPKAPAATHTPEAIPTPTVQPTSTMTPFREPSPTIVPTSQAVSEQALEAPEEESSMTSLAPTETPWNETPFAAPVGARTDGSKAERKAGKGDLTTGQAAVAATTMLLMLACPFLLLYVYFSICVQAIARKCDLENRYWAWLPFLREFLLFDIAKIPRGWSVLLYLPVLALVFYMVNPLDLSALEEMRDAGPFHAESWAQAKAYSFVMKIGSSMLLLVVFLSNFGIYLMAYLIAMIVSWMMWQGVCHALDRAGKILSWSHRLLITPPILMLAGIVIASFLPGLFLLICVLSLIGVVIGSVLYLALPGWIAFRE